MKRWLLLEQPGSWGPDAVSQSGLPERVAVELKRRTRSAGIRVILIRRGVRFTSEGRQCYFARTEASDNYLAHMTLNRASDLLDIDLDALAAGGTVPGAQDLLDPVFLVCTHGKRDACCSIRGNQVSRVACSQVGVDAWECSHIGGDRFAANLVCFPHGVYYGRVAPDEVAGLMASFGSGLISLTHFRGRSCFPFGVQAAEYFLRREMDLRGMDDMALMNVLTWERDAVSARFKLKDGRLIEVKVAVTHGPEAVRLTCGATAASLVPRYELVAWRTIEA